MKKHTLTQLGVIGVFCITIFTILAVSTVYASVPPEKPPAPTGFRIEKIENSHGGPTIAEMTGSVILEWKNPDDPTITGYELSIEEKYIKKIKLKPKTPNGVPSPKWSKRYFPADSAEWEPIPNSDHTTVRHTIDNLPIGTGSKFIFELRAVRGEAPNEVHSASAEPFPVTLRGCPFTTFPTVRYTDPTITVFGGSYGDAVDYSASCMDSSKADNAECSEQNAFFGMFIQMLKCVDGQCNPLGKPIDAGGANAGKIKNGERTFTIDKSQWKEPVSAGQVSFTSSCPAAQWSEGQTSEKYFAKTGGLFDGITHTPNTAPTFTEGDTTTRTIPEGTAQDTAIGSPLTATDTDGDTLTYSIDTQDLFTVDSATGQLKTKIALDYDTAGIHEAVVTVTDTGSLDDTITVTITVTDVPQQPVVTPPTNTAPTFTAGDTATRSIAEGTSPDTAIGSPITATDNERDTLVYSIDTQTLFKIDSTTGQLKTKINLGCTMAGAYDVVVTATDSGSLTDTITVTIRVTEACSRTTSPTNTGTTGTTGTPRTPRTTGTTRTRGNGGGTGTGGTNAENSRTSQGWGGAYLSTDSAVHRTYGGLTARQWYQYLIQQALDRISTEQVNLQQYHTAYKAAETPAEKVQYRKLFYQSAARILADIVEIRKNLLLIQALQTQTPSWQASTI